MKLHHTGWIVNNIETFAAQMLHNGLVKKVQDPVQKADLALFENFGGCFTELIQPWNDESFTWNALKKNGNHFHHFCYEVSTLEEMNQHARQSKLLLFKGPLKAILFDNRDVYFFMDRNRNIIEFLIDKF